MIRKVTIDHRQFAKNRPLPLQNGLCIDRWQPKVAVESLLEPLTVVSATQTKN